MLRMCIYVFIDDMCICIHILMPWWQRRICALQWSSGVFVYVRACVYNIYCVYVNVYVYL